MDMESERDKAPADRIFFSVDPWVKWGEKHGETSGMIGVEWCLIWWLMVVNGV